MSRLLQLVAQLVPSVAASPAGRPAQAGRPGAECGASLGARLGSGEQGTAHTDQEPQQKAGAEERRLPPACIVG